MRIRQGKIPSKRRRALMLLSMPNLGGAQLATLDIADALGAYGWNLSFISCFPGPFVEECRKRGHPCGILRTPGWYRYMGPLKRMRMMKAIGFAVVSVFLALQFAVRMTVLKPDLLYVYGRRDIPLVAPVARLLGLPVLCHIHAWREPGGAREKMALVAARCCSALMVANSQYSIDCMSRSGWKRGARIVYNGFDFDRTWDRDRKDARASLGLPSGAIVVGTASRISAVKGIDTAIRAAGLLKQRLGKPFIWLVAGREDEYTKGRLVAKYDAISTALGVDNEMRFLGYLEDMPSFYRSLDIFVSVPTFEPLGRVFIEAMAAGVPVTGSSVGGIVEIIAHGRTGWLVPPDDAEALAKRLAWILKNPKCAAAVARAGREAARSRFSQKEVMTELLDAFNATVEGTDRLRQFGSQTHSYRRGL